MKALTIVGCAVIGTILADPAAAQEQNAYDRIDLAATASADVENDLLIAVVYAEVEDNDQADAADAVNTAIAWAADRARDVRGIEIQTTNYNTRPIYASGRRITGWVARQGLRLESRDSGALSELLGELQERVAIQSISYSVSDAARDTAEDELIAQALARFNRRANLIARELGRGGFRIVRLNVGTAGGLVNPNQRLAAYGADAFPPPEIEAGTQTLSVTVNGTVELAGGE